MPVYAFDTHHGSGISVHRAAALATGAAGVYVPLPFDATNDSVADANATLSGGIVTALSEGDYCLGGVVGVTQVVLMTGAGIQLLRSGVVVAQPELQGLGIAVGGVLALAFCVPILLADGDTVEVRVASFGAGGAAVVPGRASTFLTVVAV